MIKFVCRLPARSNYVRLKHNKDSQFKYYVWRDKDSPAVIVLSKIKDVWDKQIIVIPNIQEKPSNSDSEKLILKCFPIEISQNEGLMLVNIKRVVHEAKSIYSHVSNFNDLQNTPVSFYAFICDKNQSAENGSWKFKWLTYGFIRPSRKLK